MSDVVGAESYDFYKVSCYEVGGEIGRQDKQNVVEAKYKLIKKLETGIGILLTIFYPGLDTLSFYVKN